MAAWISDRYEWFRNRSILVKTGIFHNLSSEEAYNLLVNASKNKDKLSTAPPVQPEGGTVFLYNLGENSKSWDLQKRQIR